MTQAQKSPKSSATKKLALAAWVSLRLYTDVEKIARSANRSLSYIVCDALEQYVERYKRDEAVKNGSFVDALDKRERT